MIEACGASLLPPYSPDFDPIENAYAKFKSNLRKPAARTVETSKSGSPTLRERSRQTNAPTTSSPPDTFNLNGICSSLRHHCCQRGEQVDQ
jgi:hypothetical protein